MGKKKNKSKASRKAAEEQVVSESNIVEVEDSLTSSLGESVRFSDGDEIDENIVKLFNSLEKANEQEILKLLESLKITQQGELLIKRSAVVLYTTFFSAVVSGYDRVVDFLLDNNLKFDGRDKDGNTPLALACLNGNPLVVRLLLGKGAFVDSRNQKGETPLYLASGAEHGKVRECVELLLEKNANPNILTVRESSPLLKAIGVGNFDVVKLLINHGANLKNCDQYGHNILFYLEKRKDLILEASSELDEEKEYSQLSSFIKEKLSSWDNNEYQFISYIWEKSLYSTVLRNDVIKLEKLLRDNRIQKLARFGARVLSNALKKNDRNKEIANLILDNWPRAQDKNGNTLLSAAIIEGNKDLVEFLLLRQNIDVNLIDLRGVTPIMLAASLGNVEIVNLLLAKGAHINQIADNGKTALDFALENDHEEIAIILLKFYLENYSNILAEDPDNHIFRVNRDGFSPIMIAAQRKMVLFLDTLLRNSNDVNSILLLLPALDLDDEEILGFILEGLFSINDNLNDYQKIIENLLIHAAHDNKTNSLKLLLSKGANVHTLNPNNVSVLSVSVIASSQDAVKILVQHGARDEKALQIATTQGDLEIVKLLLDQDSKNQENPVYTDEIKVSSLNNAASKGHLEIIREILRRDYYLIQESESNGIMPCHSAAKFGRIDVLKYFTEECEDLLFLEDKKGWNALYFATCGGSVEAVNFLLNYYQDPKKLRDQDGHNILHIAFFFESIDIVEILLKNKDIAKNLLTEKDKKGISPLLIAAQKKYNKLKDVFLNQDLQTINELVEIVIENGNTDLLKPLTNCIIKENQRYKNVKSKTYTLYFFRAIFHDSKEACEFFLSKEIDFFFRNDENDTLLHAATKYNRITILEMILAYPNARRVIDYEDVDHNTALDLAIKLGHLDILKILISKGANVGKSGNTEYTALHLAVQSRNEEILDFLLEDKRVLKTINDQDILGWAALDFACESGNVNAFQKLRNKGAICNKRTIREETILHIAAKNESTEIVEEILKWNSFFLDKQECDGWTALHIAVQYNNIVMVRKLIECGADINVGNNIGYTPFHIAAQRGHEELCKILYSADSSVLYQRAKNQWTALHCAADSGKTNIIKLLKSYGVDLHLLGNYNHSIFFLAAKSCKYETVLFLIDEFDINEKGAMGWTALHSAAHNGDLSIVNLLLEHDVRIKLTLRNETPLHFAVLQNHLKIAELLLQKFPKVINKKDEEGMSALSMAIRNDSLEMVKLLLQFNPDLAITDDASNSAIHFACAANNREITKTIVNHYKQHRDSESSLLHQSNDDGNIPLHMLLQDGDEEYLEFFSGFNAKEAIIILNKVVGVEYNQIIESLLNKLQNDSLSADDHKKINNFFAGAVIFSNERLVEALFARGFRLEKQDMEEAIVDNKKINVLLSNASIIYQIRGVLALFFDENIVIKAVEDFLQNSEGTKFIIKTRMELHRGADETKILDDKDILDKLASFSPEWDSLVRDIRNSFSPSTRGAAEEVEKAISEITGFAESNRRGHSNERSINKRE